VKLNGTVSIINGAGSGLGAETARLFAREGSCVTLTDINLKAAKRVSDEINAAGGNSIALRLDVTDAAETDKIVSQCVSHYGKLDILVQSAGVFTDALFLDMSEDIWDQTLDINLKGTFLSAQRAAKEMVKQKYGRIILFASIGGQRGASVTHAHYGASKAGVICMAKTVAEELAPYNITVNCVSPGIISTPLNRKMIENEGAERAAGIFMKRFGQEIDVANAVLFLAQEESGYITGSTIDVNGGMWGHI